MPKIFDVQVRVAHIQMFDTITVSFINTLSIIITNNLCAELPIVIFSGFRKLVTQLKTHTHQIIQ